MLAAHPAVKPQRMSRDMVVPVRAMGGVPSLSLYTDTLTTWGYGRQRDGPSPEFFGTVKREAAGSGELGLRAGSRSPDSLPTQSTASLETLFQLPRPGAPRLRNRGTGLG